MARHASGHLPHDLRRTGTHSRAPTTPAATDSYHVHARSTDVDFSLLLGFSDYDVAASPIDTVRGVRILFEFYKLLRNEDGSFLYRLIFWRSDRPDR